MDVCLRFRVTAGVRGAGDTEFEVLGEFEAGLLGAEVCDDAAQGGDAGGHDAEVHHYLEEEGRVGVVPALFGGEVVEVSGLVDEEYDCCCGYSGRSLAMLGR